MATMKNTAIALATLLLLSACGNFKPLEQQAGDKLKPLLEDAKQFQSTSEFVKEEKGGATPSLLVKEVEVQDPSNTISLTVQGGSFYSVADSVARKNGYTVAALEGVISAKAVNVDFRGLTFEQAMRYIGLVAGYVAVINSDNHTVTFAQQGTYTFRLPSGLLQKFDSTYSVGGDPTQSGGSGGGSGGSSGGSGGGGGSGSNTLTAKFKVDGESKTPVGGLAVFLQEHAGGGTKARVSVFKETGFVSVRGNAMQLRRIHEFLQTFAQDSMRQVKVTASIIEVVVTDKLQYGIQWKKILNAAGSRTIDYNTTGVVPSPDLAVNLTTASVTAILKALETYTTVRVVSQPSLIASNHTSATKFDGVQRPYLPSVSQTITGGGSNFSQTSGSLSYNLDGVSFSLTADIISNSQVQLRLVPVSNSVGNMQQFLNGQLQGPELATKQALMQVLVPTGYTVILGGDRYVNKTETSEGAPGVARLPGVGRALSGVNDTGSARESVLLLQAQILPPPRFETLVSEAI